MFMRMNFREGDIIVGDFVIWIAFPVIFQFFFVIDGNFWYGDVLISNMDRFILRHFASPWLNEVEEKSDEKAVDEISEHTSDDGNDEEGFDRSAITLRHSLHIGHGIGCSAHTEAASA